MADTNQIFSKKFNVLLDSLKNEDYLSCCNIAHNLVSLAWNLEIKDEVFVNEVLESVFKQLQDTIDDYTIDDLYLKKINDELTNAFTNLQTTYATKNHAELYKALRQLRYITTHYQLSIWQNRSKKRGH